jgi:YihY family inner membrane protein
MFAAALAYAGFFSLFPLLLLGLSVLGYALAGHPALRSRLSTHVVEAVPGIGGLIQDNLLAVESSRAGLGVTGLLGLAWSGTGIVAMAQQSLARVFGFAIPSGWKAKARQFGSALVLGVLALASTALAGIAGSLDGHGVAGAAVRVAGVLLTLFIDIALFLAAYAILSQGYRHTVAGLLPGAVLAGTGWTALKVGGSWYATRTIGGARAVYGTFATVVGILVLFAVGARLFLYGAELIAVQRTRRTDRGSRLGGCGR